MTAAGKPAPGELVQAVREYDPHSRNGTNILHIVNLLWRHADPNEKHWEFGETPLHLALKCEVDAYGVIKALIGNGADVNAVNDSGDTPLMYAAVYNNVPAMKLLIEKGAVLETKNFFGRDAMDHANVEGFFPLANGFKPKSMEILADALRLQQQAREKAAQKAAEAAQRRAAAGHKTASARQDMLKKKHTHKVILRPRA